MYHGGRGFVAAKSGSVVFAMIYVAFIFCKKIRLTKLVSITNKPIQLSKGVIIYLKSV